MAGHIVFCKSSSTVTTRNLRRGLHKLQQSTNNINLSDRRLLTFLKPFARAGKPQAAVTQQLASVVASMPGSV
jgi:hypothetical protein